MRFLMHTRLLAALLVVALPAAGLIAADGAQPKSKAREAWRAKLAEEAKKTATAPPPAASNTEPRAEKKTDEPTAPASAKSEKSPAKTKTADQPATVLPQVEVKKGRITELDQQISKQEQEIAREKKNTRATEVDRALNDSKIAKPLAIFGGESAQFRQRVASERVELMEAEKDILEAMKLAKTKAEKDKLQKELDELRAMRRQLETSLR